MKILAAILLSLALIPSLFEGGDSNIANFVYDACTIPMVPIVLFCLFHQIDKTKFKERGVIAGLTVIFTVKFLCYLSYMLSVNLGVVVFITTMLISYLGLTMTLTWKDENSDKVESDGTYFAFKRPKNFLDFIISIFRMPVSSFSIIQNEQWYKFSRSYEGLYTSHISAIDLNYYVIKRVADVDADILKSLVGKPWKIKSSNCITAFQPVLSILGIKLKYFDFIPAVFAYKFFKSKHID